MHWSIAFGIRVLYLNFFVDWGCYLRSNVVSILRDIFEEPFSKAEYCTD